MVSAISVRFRPASNTSCTPSQYEPLAARDASESDAAVYENNFHKGIACTSWNSHVLTLLMGKILSTALTSAGQSAAAQGSQLEASTFTPYLRAGQPILCASSHTNNISSCLPVLLGGTPAPVLQLDHKLVITHSRCELLEETSIRGP